MNRFAATLAGVAAAGIATLAHAQAPAPDAPPAAAAPDVRPALELKPGQKLVVELGANGSLRVLQTSQTTLSEMMTAAPDAKSPLDTAAPGQIVISLIDDPDGGSIMKVENGLDYSFDYLAFATVMTRQGQTVTAPTSVCTVVKGLVGLEAWDQRLDQVKVSDFIRYDAAPHCPEPEGSISGPPPPDEPAPSRPPIPSRGNAA